MAVATQQIDGEQVIALRGVMLIASKSEPGQWHAVEAGRCDCKGFEFRGACRDLAVAAKAARNAEQEAATQAPAVASAPEPERCTQCGAVLEEGEARVFRGRCQPCACHWRELEALRAAERALEEARAQHRADPARRVFLGNLPEETYEFEGQRYPRWLPA